MGRALRIESEGRLYHVLSRGNERNDIFRDDRDWYRETAQQYADIEKKLWEDFRHGMIIGTKKFVDNIRSK